MKPSGIVTLLTDFGLDDAYVGAVKGAILAVHTRTTVIDISHGARPFAVLQGAFLLDTAWRSFPPGTVAGPACLRSKAGRAVARAGSALRSLRQCAQQPTAPGAGSHQGGQREPSPNRGNLRRGRAP